MAAQIISAITVILSIAYLQELEASSFSLGCGSTFTAGTTSYCSGIPIVCSVDLDAELCLEGKDNFTAADLNIDIVDSGAESRPSFILRSQDAYSPLVVVLDYVPRVAGSVIHVQVSADVSPNCSFTVTHSSSVQSSPNSCLHPVSLDVSLQPLPPAVVRGGDVIKLSLTLTAATVAVQRVVVYLDEVHPALRLIKQVLSLEGEGEAVRPVVANVHGIRDNKAPLLGDVNLSLNESAVANFTFRVQSFVLPEASLFFSLRIFHWQWQQFGTASFEQNLRFFNNEYTSDQVKIRRYFLSLPYYNERKEDTFPPHEGDSFIISFPILVPCVSTRIRLSLSLPEFIADNYTMFYTNVTDVEVHAPENLVYISELCDYRTLLDGTECDIDHVRINNDSLLNIITAEQEGPGVDELFIDLSPVRYNMEALEGCVLDFPNSTCDCTEQRLVVSLHGYVVTTMYCENQTLADNITSSYEYVIENTATTSSPAAITFIDVTEDAVFDVNASMPATSLSMNSYTGDAGDFYNFTFTIAHNSEYSSFSAYDFNYTFSLDMHLDPEENVTICNYNISGLVACEDVPFINHTLTREGFHPE